MILKNHIYWITAITSARKEEDRNSIVSKGRGREVGVGNKSLVLDRVRAGRSREEEFCFLQYGVWSREKQAPPSSSSFSSIPCSSSGPAAKKEEGQPHVEQPEEGELGISFTFNHGIIF